MRLAVIAGDGIGPEVIDEALQVLDAVLPGVEKTEYDLGARRYHATGEVLPPSVLDELRGYDAIHLSSALLWQEDLGEPVVVATFDRELEGAAVQAGMRAWPAKLGQSHG